MKTKNKSILSIVFCLLAALVAVLLFTGQSPVKTADEIRKKATKDAVLDTETVHVATRGIEYDMDADDITYCGMPDRETFVVQRGWGDPGIFYGAGEKTVILPNGLTVDIVDARPDKLSFRLSSTQAPVKTGDSLGTLLFLAFAILMFFVAILS